MTKIAAVVMSDGAYQASSRSGGGGCVVVVRVEEG